MSVGKLAAAKARYTARWATTMTKWRISRTDSRIGWQLVSFCGPGGCESRGVVDLIAIRKDHRRSTKAIKAGDLFEIVLIQIKGGAARWPSRQDIDRLSSTAKYHRAKAVVLAEWKRGAQPTLYRLSGKKWRLVEASEIFS